MDEKFPWRYIGIAGQGQFPRSTGQIKWLQAHDMTRDEYNRQAREYYADDEREAMRRRAAQFF